ncbi:MAG: hypothetical protein HYU69_07965 [Bacteroidetes bacterium]|nr:hypothetical protein [Bacteroidota bacterium]
MENKNLQYVQPEISRSKFESEIQEFLKIQDVWRQKGVVCVKAEFPVAHFIFIAHYMKPPAVAFAVSIDFTNYDVEPPSIVFIDPFTGAPVTRKQMGPLKFIQQKAGGALQINGQVMPFSQPQDLLVGQGDEYPFLCLPGVREYHNHPQHSGNAWLLHRTRGEGTLGFLLTKLYDHAIPSMRGYHIQFNVNIQQQF